MLIKGGGGEWDMCVLDCRCMCGSTVGVWRRAVGPAAILRCCVVWQRGAQEGANMRELRGECGGNRGTIRGDRRGASVRKQRGLLGEQRSERGGTEKRAWRQQRDDSREQRDGRGGTEGMEGRGWGGLRAVWGEVGGHGVMVRGCDGAVDTAAVWFPVV